MLNPQKPCVYCGRTPVKGFAQRLGETVLIYAVLGAAIVLLTLIPGAGA